MHKFIVASARLSDANGQAKRAKDLQQAKLLFEAMALTRRQDDLAEAFSEAWRRGAQWRTAIGRGISFLSSADRADVLDVLNAGLANLGETLTDLPKP